MIWVRGDLRRLRAAHCEGLATRRKGENTMAEFVEVMKQARRMCNDCRNQPIPADIAEKLGIKPKEA